MRAQRVDELRLGAAHDAVWPPSTASTCPVM
jgi:hypothetical protein